MTTRTCPPPHLGIANPKNCRLNIGASLVVALLACSIDTALAAEPIQLTDASFMDIQAQVKSSKGFPNEEHRLRGLMSYQNGEYRDAAASFERAAYHADKFAQHYLSLMHWHGVGVAHDPVQGYIWADLAAERGNPQLLALREKMWSQLTSQQQAEAETRGGQDYARYGDPAAKPRTDAAIRRFARDMTGSHVGYRNLNVGIIHGGPINGSFGNVSPGILAASAMVVGTTTSEQFYADSRMSADAYWKAQDRMLGAGRVEVGPVSVDRGEEGESR